MIGATFFLSQIKTESYKPCSLQIEVHNVVATLIISEYMYLNLLVLFPWPSRSRSSELESESDFGERR